LRASIRNEKGDSPEAAAREARYALLADALEPGEVLVTAQHRDDQAETLLLQLLRGAGVAGLAAMPPIAPFARGHIARPLLDHARAELERDARRWRLEWIEDPTNTATRFARNYLRHEVLPVLRKRWPTLDTALARSARHMAEAQALLDALAGADIARARDGAGLHVATLRALPVARRRNLLRAFVVAAGLESPSAAQLEEIAVTLLGVRADARPEVRWSGARIRRRGGRLELEVISQESAGQAAERPAKSWRWTSERELIVNAAGDRLRLVDDPAGPIDLDRLPHALELRARVGGEHLRPGPRSRTQSLKKLLQAARIPADERARLPLLFAGSGSRRRLVVVADRWIDASIAANVKSRHRARVRWSRQGAG
jgi:tRNA(Ile)-lysidine synthase